MSDSGLALDHNSKTVLLVGHTLISQLMALGPAKKTLTHFNEIARSLVKLQGPSYGIDPTKEDLDEWCLGATTQEDAVFLFSHLEDPRAEVAHGFVQEALIPVKERMKCLH